jgi:hypothetical protein
VQGSPALPLWQAAASGVLGLLFVFAGYRSMRFTARLASALLFATVGLLLASRLPNPWAVAGIMLGAGVVGYLLGNALYFLNVALNGAGAGVVVAALVATALGREPSPVGALSGLLAGAALALALQRPIGVLGTALVGAALATMALRSALLAGGLHAPDRFAWGYVLFLLGLAALGSVVQWKTTRNLPAKGAPPAAEPARP